jgi:hypothetical protein
MGTYRYSNPRSDENSNFTLEDIFRWRSEGTTHFDLWHPLTQTWGYLDELPPPSCPL